MDNQQLFSSNESPHFLPPRNASDICAMISLFSNYFLPKSIDSDNNIRNYTRPIGDFLHKQFKLHTIKPTPNYYYLNLSWKEERVQHERKCPYGRLRQVLR